MPERPALDHKVRPARDHKVYGQSACRAIFERRPGDISRAYLLAELREPLGRLLDRMAEARKPFKFVTPAELEALTESTHHEGVCLVVRRRETPPLSEILAARGPGGLLLLADVSNPHNVGAILRTAAHFGVRAALVPSGRERLPPSALRIAEGGAEWLDVIPAPHLDAALDACERAGFALVATSSHARPLGSEGPGSVSLFEARLPGRWVLLLGSESEGLPPHLLARARTRLFIPGTGHVESLNVATAAAVVLGELWRRGHA
jgi:TrmH RNA methyltransferase